MQRQISNSRKWTIACGNGLVAMSPLMLERLAANYQESDFLPHRDIAETARELAAAKRAAKGESHA